MIILLKINAFVYSTGSEGRANGVKCNQKNECYDVSRGTASCVSVYIKKYDAFLKGIAAD